MNEKVQHFLEELFSTTELNRLHEKYGGGRIFSTPIIGVAKGDDPIFEKFKEVVGPEHFTPVELWRACGQDEESPSNLRILSIVFPYVDRIREESKDFIEFPRVKLPADIYSLGRNYANEFKKETCRQSINFFKNHGYNAVAAMVSEVFSIYTKGNFYSNWSERHIAYAAALGTFSLTDALITEAGCNVRFTSVVTNAPLQITPRKSDNIHANCLYYAKGTCRQCEKNCPANAIDINGHDKNKCWAYGQKIERKMRHRIGDILKPHFRYINGEWQEQQPPVGCAFCQFDVPCMDKNPMAAEQKE